MKKLAAFIPSSKQRNKAKILKLLGERGPLPRQKLAVIMDLTPATITNLTAELLKDKQIHEVGYNQGKKGRKGPKSINLDVRSDFFWMIGVHITFKRIEIASVNLKGNVEDFQLEHYPAEISEEAFGDLLKRVIRKYMETHSQRKFVAIGVGAFGLVNNDGLLLKVKHFPDWYHMDIQQILTANFRLPVIVNHHIRAMTLAERKFNIGKHTQNFLVVYVGEGIGAGMFIDGKLSQRGGQLAHMNYEINGKPCWCGQKGCLEQYVSEGVIQRELNTCDISEIRKYTIENDTHTIETLYKYGQILGTEIASFLQMIPMDCIILNGRLFFEGSPMIEGAKDKVQASMKYYEERPEFVKETMTHDQTIGVIGAASIVMESTILEAHLSHADA